MEPRSNLTHPFDTLHTGAPAKQEYMEDVRIVGRPKTTDHNLSDDYVKHPPRNHDLNTAVEKPSKIETRAFKELTQGNHRTWYVRGEEEVMGVSEQLGRATKEEGLAGIAEDDSVHA